MVTIRKNPLNSNISNFNDVKTNKRFEKTLEAVSKAEPLPEQVPEISFEKSVQSLNFDVPEPEQPKAELQPETETPPVPEREERRAAFKRAADVERRAMQLKKKAEEDIASASQFKQFMALAKEDPTAVAKALGMEPGEFLRQYQNKIFSIPTEPTAPKEITVEERLAKLDEERKQERAQFAEWNTQKTKQDYVSNKILPVLMGNTEKFEILTHKGANEVASYIYDLMNEHYKSTGEEWKVEDVAEEFENQLCKEYEEAATKAMKLKKLSKFFREDTSAEADVIGVPAELGENPSTTNPSVSDFIPETRPQERKSLSTSHAPSEVNSSNSYQKQASWDRKREDRLSKINNVVKKLGITKNI